MPLTVYPSVPRKYYFVKKDERGGCQLFLNESSGIHEADTYVLNYVNCIATANTRYHSRSRAGLVERMALPLKGTFYSSLSKFDLKALINYKNYGSIERIVGALLLGFS